LRPIAKYGGTITSQHLERKDCDDAGLTMRILSWPKNIGVPHYGVAESIQIAIQEEISLQRKLADSVMADRCRRIFLIHWNTIDLTVTGTACGGVKKFFDLILHGEFQKAQSSDDIDSCVK